MKEIHTTLYKKVKKNIVVGASHRNSVSKKNRNKETGMRISNSRGCGGCRRR